MRLYRPGVGPDISHREWGEKGKVTELEFHETRASFGDGRYRRVSQANDTVEKKPLQREGFIRELQNADVCNLDTVREV